MKTLRREIHPKIKVLDASQGLVEYVASSQTIDSYKEIVRADGAQFNRFEKNAPFVDSHNYGSIDCLLGRVVNCEVSGNQVVETVKWAIDVPQNTLAQKGFAMTQGGYLRAVSIGFMPISQVSRYGGNTADFNDALKDLGLAGDADVNCIYTAWEQLELSACVIGANPDAVANVERALRDGLLTDRDIETFSRMSPAFGKSFQKRSHKPRTYTFGSNPGQGGGDAVSEMIRALGGTPAIKIDNNQQPKTMSIPNSTPAFKQLSQKVQAAFGNIESKRQARGAGSELQQAVTAALRAIAQEKRNCYGDPVTRYLDAAPERRVLWNGIFRTLAGKMRADGPEFEVVQRAVSGISLQDSFGPGLLERVPIADEVWDLILNYGAYRYLGLRTMVGAYTLYPKATGFPNAVFITPTQQGQTTIPEDNSLTGIGLGPLANTIATLITCSMAWLEDEKVDLSEVLLSKMVMGIAARIDWGCFAATGADDPVNGMCTGLFYDNTIKASQVDATKTQIGQLVRSDFINVVGTVAPAALQRMDTQPPRWYISPVLIPQLLQLWDDKAKQYLLKTPAETGHEWLLVGFPVTWAAAAPSVTNPSSKIAVFGNPDAMLVSLHDQFEVTLGRWSQSGMGGANVQFRTLTRGRNTLREATGFATLQLGV